MQLKPIEFWQLTYAEFSAMLDGYNKREKKKSDEIITLAWYSEVLHRTKELPELSDLLKETKQKEPQSDEDMLAMCKLLNAAFGGEIVEV